MSSANTDNKNVLQLKLKEASPSAGAHAAFSCCGLSVQHLYLALSAEFEFKWDGSSHYLAHHDLVLLDGEVEVAGEKPVAGRDLRGQMTYVPRGQTIDRWSKPADQLNAFTVVCFDPAVLEQELETDLGGFDERPRIYFEYEELACTMRKLSRLMGRSGPPGLKGPC